MKVVIAACPVNKNTCHATKQILYLEAHHNTTWWELKNKLGINRITEWKN